MNDIKNFLSIISSLLLIFYLLLAIINYLRAIKRSKRQNGNIQ